MNDTQQQANELIEAMRRAGVPSFHPDVFGLLSRKMVEEMVRNAKRLHTIAEHNCNGYEYKGMLAKEANLERAIIETAKGFGLDVVFQGDPRGYVVKLKTPKGDVYNTWGGSEEGYGIG